MLKLTKLGRRIDLGECEPATEYLKYSSAITCA